MTGQNVDEHASVENSEESRVAFHKNQYVGSYYSDYEQFYKEQNRQAVADGAQEYNYD